MKNSLSPKNHIRQHEKRQALRREQLGFQNFIMHRFLVILLYVVVFEYISKALMDRFIMPVITKLLLDSNGRDISLSMTETLIFVGFLFIGLLLTAANNFLPAIARGWIQIAEQQLERWTKQFVPKLEEYTYNMEMEALEILLLCLAIFLVIILFVTPILVAAFWFSKVVINEVRNIEENKEALQRDYEEKRNLMLSDIAHDLRTPITTIAGYARALNDEMVTDEEKKKEYLEAIENKSERMSDLINLLFEYVKLDSTGFELKPETVNITELLRENAALLYSDVEDKGMELEIDVPEESCMMKVDPLQFSRVVTNLINNAIRHNEKGTTITLRMVSNEDEVTVVVSDNGELIPKKVADHIFEPFMVGDASRKTKGGSGLGLSIAKKIVEMHGGTLRLRQNSPEYKKAFIIKFRKETYTYVGFF